MADKLTTDEILLLNNLMYMTKEEPLNSITDYNGGTTTVGDIVDSINTGRLNPDKDYGSFMTGKDWDQLVKAVKTDDRLMEVQLESVYVDNSETGGGGTSAVFSDPASNEAVVVFRGTASQEWKDNFTGGGITGTADGVSTNQQMNALEWYQSLDLDGYDSVSVSGHSKGGNKAKYITIMDDSVDRCISFDGQGFSDEYIKKYKDSILLNQGKIENHNVDSDYVNLLLNDVGNTTFYKGYDYGKGGFLENHCPNTFFDFHEDGTWSMEISTRNPDMAQVDQYLNSYLRTLSPEEKKASLEMIGTLVQGGFNGAGSDEMLAVLLNDNNLDQAADLIAYTIKYQQENPEIIGVITKILNDMNMGDMAGVTEAVSEVMNSRYFEGLLGASGFLLDHMPDWLLEKLNKFLKDKFGLTLTEKELKQLLSLVGKVSDHLDEVKITDQGKDMDLNSQTAAGSIGKADFWVDLNGLAMAGRRLEECCQELKEMKGSFAAAANNLPKGFGLIKTVIRSCGQQVNVEAQECQQQYNALQQIQKYYLQVESKITQNAAQK